MDSMGGTSKPISNWQDLALIGSATKTQREVNIESDVISFGGRKFLIPQNREELARIQNIANERLAAPEASRPLRRGIATKQVKDKAIQRAEESLKGQVVQKEIMNRLFTLLDHPDLLQEAIENGWMDDTGKRIELTGGRYAGLTFQLTGNLRSDRLKFIQEAFEKGWYSVDRKKRVINFTKGPLAGLILNPLQGTPRADFLRAQITLKQAQDAAIQQALNLFECRVAMKEAKERLSPSYATLEILGEAIEKGWTHIDKEGYIRVVDGPFRGNKFKLPSSQEELQKMIAMANMLPEGRAPSPLSEQGPSDSEGEGASVRSDSASPTTPVNKEEQQQQVRGRVEKALGFILNNFVEAKNRQLLQGRKYIDGILKEALEDVQDKSGGVLSAFDAAKKAHCDTIGVNFKAITKSDNATVIRQFIVDVRRETKFRGSIEGTEVKVAPVVIDRKSEDGTEKPDEKYKKEVVDASLQGIGILTDSVADSAKKEKWKLALEAAACQTNGNASNNFAIINQSTIAFTNTGAERGMCLQQNVEDSATEFKIVLNKEQNDIDHVDVTYRGFLNLVERSQSSRQGDVVIPNVIESTVSYTLRLSADNQPVITDFKRAVIRHDGGE